MKQFFAKYAWTFELLYMALGFFNILFAWFGMIFFVTPLVMAIGWKDKQYCHHYCGRGQLFALLGKKIGRKTTRPAPKFLRSRWFRYGFLAFFMVMFILMIVGTYGVFRGAPLREALTILWTFHLPWDWVDVSMVSPWMAQFAFGFFSIMLTSVLLGVVSLLFYRPRTFCVYCPMGTMTQGICMLRNYDEVKTLGREGEEGSRTAADSGQ